MSRDRDSDLARLEEIADLVPKLLRERRKIWKRRQKDTTNADLGRASGVTRSAVGREVNMPDEDYRAGDRSGRPKES